MVKKKSIKGKNNFQKFTQLIANASITEEDKKIIIDKLNKMI